MLKYSKGQKISLNLTLINNNSSPEPNADVKYEIYNDNNNIIYSNNNLLFNEQLGSYIDIIDPDIQWTNQEEGLYHIKWYISNTVEEYPETVIEDLYIERYDDKLDKILGLVHQNIYIDKTDYDKNNNMISARLTIYKDSDSVGTENNILAQYKIECDAEARGTFISWKQTEIT